MPLTLLRHELQKPPPGIVKLDVGHPFAANLSRAYLLNAVNDMYVIDNLLSGQVASIGTTNVIWQGQSLRFTNHWIVMTSGTPAPTLAGAFTISLSGYPDSSTPGNQCFYSQSNSTSGSNDNTIHIQTANGAMQFNLWNDDLSGSWTWVGGQPVRIVCTFDKNKNQSVYINGNFLATRVSTNFYLGGGSTWSIGARVDGANPVNGNLIDLFIWDGRAFTAAEVMAHTAEPYAMFQTRTLQRWPVIPVIAGATGENRFASNYRSAGSASGWRR